MTIDESGIAAARAGPGGSSTLCHLRGTPATAAVPGLPPSRKSCQQARLRLPHCTPIHTCIPPGCSQGQVCRLPRHVLFVCVILDVPGGSRCHTSLTCIPITSYFSHSICENMFHMLPLYFVTHQSGGPTSPAYLKPRDRGPNLDVLSPPAAVQISSRCQAFFCRPTPWCHCFSSNYHQLFPAPSSQRYAS